MSGWIGFDLDGTLAEYVGFRGPGIIGEPIPKMLDVLKNHIERGEKEGYTCKIFTARVWTDGSTKRNIESLEAHLAIVEWCIQHLGFPLEITCVKDYSMWALYDDRAIQVQKNSGRILGRPSFILDSETDP